MQFEIHGAYTAGELFTLKTKSNTGRPAFANLAAVGKTEWRGRPELHGPGVYGVFCKGELAYIGIYTDHKGKTFAGTVFDRWSKHLTYFSMRTPELAFSPRNMERVLRDLPNHFSDAFRAILGNGELSMANLQALDIPMLRGRSCTYNKARFAAANWDVFAPGNENKMLEAVSFVYARFTPPAPDRSREVPAYGSVKKQWLGRRERALIGQFKPICNKETKDFFGRTSVDQFIDGLGSVMSEPLE